MASRKTAPEASDLVSCLSCGEEFLAGNGSDGRVYCTKTKLYVALCTSCFTASSASDRKYVKDHTVAY